VCIASIFNTLGEGIPSTTPACGFPLTAAAVSATLTPLFTPYSGIADKRNYP
jgi:hypothetical protein